MEKSLIKKNLSKLSIIIQLFSIDRIRWSILSIVVPVDLCKCSMLSDFRGGFVGGLKMATEQQGNLSVIQHFIIGSVCVCTCDSEGRE